MPTKEGPYSKSDDVKLTHENNNAWTKKDVSKIVEENQAKNGGASGPLKSE